MESESRSENDAPTLESVCANIARLKRRIHDKTILMLRNMIGDVRGLSGFQIYMKFKSVVMNLDEFFRPEESSWPVVLLEVFIPRSVNWPAKIRLDKMCEIKEFIMEVENALKANEFNVSECNESVESDKEYEDSQFYRLENSNQQSDSMHNVESPCYDDDCQEEKKYDNSSNLSSSEYVTMLIVKVLSKEEDLWDNQNSNFSEYMTNESAVVNVSRHPDNDISQGEEIRDEFLLSVDEISNLLAHDFERYANQSKDACVLKRYANSYGEVIFPKYDVEKDIVSECAMSGLGVVCDSNLYINAHNEFYDENERREIRVVADSMFSYFHKAEISSDSPCDKRNTNEIVYPSELFEKELDTDQYILDMQFHDNSYDLKFNQLLKCEEIAVCVQSDVGCIDNTDKKKSDSAYFSYLEAQGELQSDLCNSFNEVEYQAFVFPVEGIHDSISSDQSYLQSDVSYYDHTDSYFHSEQGVESLSDFYMHYEDDDSSFVLPNEVIKNVDVLGETNGNENFSLPQENGDENRVYDRGKQF